MPAKSRHRKGKYSIQSKRKGSPSSPNLSAQQPQATQTHQPASSPVAPAPATNVVAPAAKPATVRYLYITSELRTIGILASIMLVVLVVLALVLS